MLYDTGYLKSRALAVGEMDGATMDDLAAWMIQESIRRKAADILEKNLDSVVRKLFIELQNTPIGKLLYNSVDMEGLMDDARHCILYGKPPRDDCPQEAKELADEYLDLAATQLYNQFRG